VSLARWWNVSVSLIVLVWWGNGVVDPSEEPIVVESYVF